MKLNYNTLQCKQDEVEFFGKAYTTSGCKPAKDKVSAITAMPSPTNKKQVQSFIGMINYVSKFSLRLSELAEPLRELSNDKVPFNWGPEHQQAFTQMKKKKSNEQCSHTITPRSKQCCRQMPASKVLVLVYCKRKNQCILQVKLSQMPRKVICP